MNGRQQIQYIAHTISPTILNSIITYIPSPVFPPLSFSPYPFQPGLWSPWKGRNYGYTWTIPDFLSGRQSPPSHRVPLYIWPSHNLVTPHLSVVFQMVWIYTWYCPHMRWPPHTWPFPSGIRYKWKAPDRPWQPLSEPSRWDVQWIWCVDTNWKVRQYSSWKLRHHRISIMTFV